MTEIQQIRLAQKQVANAMQVLAISALNEAVKKAGGSTRLAQKLGVTRQRVNNWKKRGAAEDFCLQIEAASGVEAERLAPWVDWVSRKTESKKVARNGGEESA